MSNIVDDLRTFSQRYKGNKDQQYLFFAVDKEAGICLTGMNGSMSEIGLLLTNTAMSDKQIQSIVLAAAGVILCDNEGLKEVFLDSLERNESKAG